MRTNRQHSAPSATITALHSGFVEGAHRGGTGLWVRVGGMGGSSWFAPFADNPGISANTPDGARVEFEIGESRGRPVAINAVAKH
jgi:hypothetical protein